MVVRGLTIEDHDHDDFVVTTSILCIDCGDATDACAMCGKILHNCNRVQEKLKDIRIPPGYRVVDEFPDYMVNKQATVRYIAGAQRYCMLVRVSKTGGAMINLRKDGKTYTRAAQEVRDKAFSG